MKKTQNEVRAYQAMFRYIALKHGRTTAEVARTIYFQSQSCKPEGPFGMTHEGVQWVYDRIKDLAYKCCMSIRTVQRALRILIDEGFIFARKFFKEVRSHMKFYRWNFQKPIPDPTQTKTEKTPQNTSENPSNSTKCKILDVAKIAKSFIQRDYIIKKDQKNISEIIPPMQKNPPPNPPQGFLRAAQNSIMSLTSHFKRGNYNRSVEEQTHKQALKRIITQVSGEHCNNPDRENAVMDSIKDILDNPTPYQEVCDIWNKHLSHKCGYQALDPKTITAIEEIWHTYFKGSISSFERFCKLLCTSPYIMSENFSMTLASALKLSFLDKIKGGGLGVDLSTLKDDPIPTVDSPQYIHWHTPVKYSALEEPHVTLNTNSDESRNLQSHAKALLGEIVYKAWLSDAPVRMIDGVWKFTTTSAFRRQKWNTDPRLEQLRREGHLDV